MRYPGLTDNYSKRGVLLRNLLSKRPLFLSSTHCFFHEAAQPDCSLRRDDHPAEINVVRSFCSPARQSGNKSTYCVCC